VQRVDIRQPGVSRHLRILEDTGFVLVRPDGQRRWYSLRAEPFGAVTDWMRRVAQVQGSQLERLARLVEAPTRRRANRRKP